MSEITPVCKPRPEGPVETAFIDEPAPDDHTGQGSLLDLNPRFKFLTLQPSRLLQGFIIVIHLLALVSIWVSALAIVDGGGYGVVISIAVLASCWWSLIRYLDSASMTISFGEEGWLLSWPSQLPGSTPESCQLAQRVTLIGDVLIWSWLMVLRVRLPSQKIVSLLILSDNACPEQIRRLRVMLTTYPQCFSG